MAYNKSLIVWLLGIALICMIASLILPTWSYTFSVRGTGNNSYVAPYGAGSIDNGIVLLTDFSGGPLLAIATLLVMTLVTISTLTAVIFNFRREDGVTKHHGRSSTLLTSGVLAILTPLTFSYLWPNEFGTTFLGSSNNYSANIGISWGPSFGWFIQIVAFVLILMVIIIVFTSNRELRFDDELILTKSRK